MFVKCDAFNGGHKCICLEKDLCVILHCYSSVNHKRLVKMKHRKTKREANYSVV